MVKEKSCGAVVFTRKRGKIKFLLIRNPSGVYGFPKGHVEGKETEEETALREVHEEVDLHVRLLAGFRTEEFYFLPSKQDTLKQVIYFLGEYENQRFTYRKEELSGALLTDYETAMGLFRFENTRRILTEARDYLLKSRAAE